MKYGKEIIKEICNHIASGLGRVDACELAGIHYDTFTIWMKKSEFYEAIKKAEVEFKQTLIGQIKKAGQRQWQANAWLLERKFQDEFVIKQKIEHSGDISIDFTSGDTLLSRTEAKNLSPK